SPYRDILSDAILKLQDEGLIQQYYNKWWKEESNVKCDTDDKRGSIIASELGFVNVGGIFLILAVGLIMSTCVAIIEFTWKIRNKKGRHISICKEMRRYFRYAVFNIGSGERRASIYVKTTPFLETIHKSPKLNNRLYD
ncbi:unnamed protein product, partial [Didymodactylos carnosus]